MGETDSEVRVPLVGAAEDTVAGSEEDMAGDMVAGTEDAALTQALVDALGMDSLRGEAAILILYTRKGSAYRRDIF